MEPTLSRDQAVFLSAAVYVCALALIIAAAFFFEEPFVLVAVIPTLLPDLLPKIGRWLNPPPSSPAPRQTSSKTGPWPSDSWNLPGSSAPRHDGPAVERVPYPPGLQPSQSQPVEWTNVLRIAISATGTAFFVTIIVLCAIILAVVFVQFFRASDFGNDALKNLGTTIGAVTGIITACAALATKARTFAKATLPAGVIADDKGKADRRV